MPRKAIRHRRSTCRPTAAAASRSADARGQALRASTSTRRTTRPAAPRRRSASPQSTTEFKAARRRGDRRVQGQRRQPRQVQEEARPVLPARPPTRPARVVEAFGAWVEKSMYGKKYMGIDRSTFLVGADGRIARGLAQGQGAGPRRGGAGGRARAGRGERRPVSPRTLDRSTERLYDYSAEVGAARAPGARAACAQRPTRCPTAACAARPSRPAPGLPARADRRPARARGRLLHRLQHARHGPGPAAGRPRGDPRRQRATGPRSAAAYWRAGGRRGPDRAPVRPGAGAACDRLLAEDGAGQLRPRLHRRRQEALRRPTTSSRSSWSARAASSRWTTCSGDGAVADPADRSPQTERCGP